MRITTKILHEITEPGRYYDDGAPGLFVLARQHANKKTGQTFLRLSFVQRLTIDGKRVDLGLGSPKWGATTISQARAKALANYRVARNGGDPRIGRAGVPTFEAALDEVLKIQRQGWRDAGKSEKQWRASLMAYAKPLMRKPVNRISAADILSCLAPHWHDRAETLRRVKQRIGVIMRWAVSQGHRADDPSHAVGAALPRQNGNKKHHRALPYAEVGGAIRKMRESGAWLATKAAFEFIVLTAVRSGEARKATWDEIDWEAAVWTIPAARMKAGKAHRVPLSDRAVAVLRDVEDLSGGEGLIFPSATGRAMSDMTISKTVKELGIAAVPHGFRSSFRDWCADMGQPREVAEACLAHVVKGVEGAYARSDLLDRRRGVMDAWAAFVAVDEGKVVPLARARG